MELYAFIFFSADTVVILCPRAEPVQVFTDDLGRKVTVPAHQRELSLYTILISLFL